VKTYPEHSLEITVKVKDACVTLSGSVPVTVTVWLPVVVPPVNAVTLI